MSTTITTADLMLAPVPTATAADTTPAKAAKAAKAADTTPARTTPVMPTTADLDAEHASATAAGEIRAVFGVTADLAGMVSVRLTVARTLNGAGRYGAVEQVAARPYAGDASKCRLRRAADGLAITAGRTVNAPTTGDAYASTAVVAYLVGSGLDAVTPVYLDAAGPRSFRSAETAHAFLLTGAGDAVAFSVAVSVRVMRGGATWSINARVFSGGALPDADLDTVALASVAATRPATAADLDALAATATTRKRSAGKRAAK